MRRALLSVLALGTLNAGCATHRDAGAALVGAGMATAIVSGVAATRTTSYSAQGVTRGTSTHGGIAAAGVAAGVALAAIGAAVAEGPPEAPPRKPVTASATNPVRNPHYWRLARPTEDPGHGPTEVGE